jgi:hypothetical protein
MYPVGLLFLSECICMVRPLAKPNRHTINLVKGLPSLIFWAARLIPRVGRGLSLLCILLGSRVVVGVHKRLKSLDLSEVHYANVSSKSRTQKKKGNVETGSSKKRKWAGNTIVGPKTYQSEIQICPRTSLPVL